MKNVNEFEKSLIIQGLELLMNEMISEIDAVEATGKNPLMTKGFVKMTIDELVEKIETSK
jgi:hypothetical protein